MTQSYATSRWFVATMVVCLWAGVCAGVEFAGGTGEPNDPYQIATAEQLISIGSDPNLLDKCFLLVNDIDLDPNLPGGQIFDKAVIAPAVRNPSGSYLRFTGVFDGNDHVVSNLTIAGASYLGLFGLFSGAVNRVRLLNVEISGSGYCVGSLAGYNCYGTVIQCSSSGLVDGYRDVGGLVGRNYGNIVVSSSGGTTVGVAAYVGGLVGYNTGGIGASYSTSATTGTDEDVGGLLGFNAGSVISSYSTGATTGFRYVGGFAGYSHGCIVACYSMGSVMGTYDVAGFVGYNHGCIAASYSAGSVAGTASVGGFVSDNYMDGRVTSSFWDIEKSGIAASDGGTGRTTTEMHDIETFLSAGWDFIDEIPNGTCDYWEIPTGEYPQLCCFSGATPVMPKGLGTPEQPYLIRDARDLGTVWFQPTAHYRLAAFIDLSGTTWSTAVVPWFEGTFDGNARVISNLHIQGDSCLGLFGQLESGAVVFNLGLEAVDINGTGNYVAGLVGCHKGCIGTSYSVGSVAGVGADIGGLVGLNDGSIAMSYSRGAIRSGGSHVGGLVGGNGRGGSITTSYTACANTGAESDVAGLVGGGLSSRVTASFWDVDTSGLTWSAGGTGLTTAEMQTAATFLDAGWDFENTWMICEGVDYPRLRWEGVECEDGL